MLFAFDAGAKPTWDVGDETLESGVGNPPKPKSRLFASAFDFTLRSGRLTRLNLDDGLRHGLEPERDGEKLGLTGMLGEEGEDWDWGDWSKERRLSCFFCDSDI